MLVVILTQGEFPTSVAGMAKNPSSACIAQAWGLAELQRGNVVRAIKLLDRCVVLDPAMQPVKNWRVVKDAAVLADHLASQQRGSQSACENVKYA
jgi:hypothetical protein